MNSFVWKNKDSYLDYGIVISVLPPAVKPEKNVDEIQIPGRDGDLTIDYNTYKPITFPITCTVLDETKINDIKDWLDGQGDLIFSWQPDKKYKAKHISRIDISISLKTLGEFTLLFKAQPHAYASDNSIITLTQAGTVYNPSLYLSNPIIKIYGAGDIDLTINESVIHLDNVFQYVTVDSERMDAYWETVLKNNDMSGDFPVLVPGNNNIDWTGIVTKIEITPNWRYL